MLGKLLKYDLRSMLKSFLLIWGGVLVISLINHFTLNNSGRLTGMLGAFSAILPMLLYVAIVIAMIVLTLLCIIQRFYNGLLKDEGYLMFTLPVRPWQLITSKGLSAVIITLISAFVGVASVLILMTWDSAGRALRTFFSIFDGKGELSTGHTILLAFEIFLLVLFSAAKGIYQIYAAIALGHLFRRHRVGMAFVMYIAISAVLSVLSSLIISALYAHSDAVMRVLSNFLVSASLAKLSHSAVWLLIAITVVQLVLFHVITERVLSKRLNLE